MEQIKKNLFLLLFLLGTFGLHGQEISPLLVGNNLWYKDPSQQVWNLTKDCGVGLIRIGGADYDQNMPSTTTLLGWVKKIESINAVPIIQVSQYQSAANAAAVVKYFNKESHGNLAPVKYWCIGNEPILQANWPSAATFAATVEAYYKPIAAAMKAIDSTIIIYGPDECDYMDYYNDLFGGKNDISGKVPGHTYYYCDGLSWHRYPQGSGDPATEGAADMLERIKKAKVKVDYVNNLHNRTGKDALQWGIGEYNSKGGAEVHTWGNGQMFGAVLGGCMKYGAQFAATWSMFENGGIRQGSDFSSIDGNMTPRASYRHMQFIAKYFKGVYADGKSSNSNITVFGSKNADTISVMIMNTSYGALEYSLHLNFDSLGSNGVLLNIDAANSKKYSDIIIGRSTQVIVFKGDKITKYIYTSSDFELDLPPTQTTVVISSTAPNAPANLNGNALSYKSISLTWNTTTDTVLGYFIERKADTENSFKMVGLVNGDKYSYTDATLVAETNYSFRIRAYNTAGKSEYSDTINLTTLQTPAHIPYKGPHTIPGKIQIEDFDNNEEGISFHDLDATNKGGMYRTSLGVDIETCTDINGGYNVGYIGAGEWLDYTISTITAGTYDIAFRVASNTTGTKKIKIYLDNKYLGFVTPTNTAGWQNWTTIYLKNVAFTDGNNQILKLTFEGVDYNLNWIEIGENLSTDVKSVKKEDFSAYYDASNKNIFIQLQQPLAKAKIEISDLSGRKISSLTNSNLLTKTINTENLKPGAYLLSVSSQNNKWSKVMVIY
jgi:hypothetical protein